MEKLGQLQLALFLLIIFAEAFFSIRHNFHEYKIKDTLANTCIAFMNWVVNIFVKGATLLLLIGIQKLSLFDFGNTIVCWIILLLLTDLAHYGFHYLEHKSRFFWATHSIHHSSNSFNFSVAIRTAHSSALYRLIYEIPLCLMGFDAYMVVTAHGIILLFGFFQHTEAIKKLGWLEYFLNTPSHHRVHHACDEKYLDKNFGGMLIIWDKLFGTFQAEEEKPTYGLTKPVKTHNPIKIIFHEWVALAKDLIKARSWKERWSYLFSKPGWSPETETKAVISAPVKKKKAPCKKCAQCSLKCMARLENMKNKMNAFVLPPVQSDKPNLPTPVAA